MTWFAGSGPCLLWTYTAFANKQSVGGTFDTTMYSTVVGGGLAHEVLTGTQNTKRDLWHPMLVERLNPTTHLTFGHHELASFLLGDSSARVHADGHDFNLWRGNGSIQIQSASMYGKRDGDTLAAAIEETTDNGWPEYGEDQAEILSLLTTSFLNGQRDADAICIKIGNDNGSNAYAKVISVTDFTGEVQQTCTDDSIYD